MSQPSGQDAVAAGQGGASHGWIAHVTLACVVGIALAGMVSGFYDPVDPIGQPDYTTRQSALSADNPSVPQAVTYTKMKDAGFGPNAQWYTVWPEIKEVLIPPEDSLFTPPSAQSREAANARRARTRAFYGAPPIVPHAIDQQSAASCLVCHGEGLEVGPVIAPQMSHKVYADCTQCHVDASNNAIPPAPGSHVPDSLFEGLGSLGQGERAGFGAPPTIPHAVWMRENCSSCHGVRAEEGLRTSHPTRSNCVQCHAPTAGANQSQESGNDRPPVMPWDRK